MPADAVTLVDVAPRDGLQTLPEVWSVADRASLCEALSGAGLDRVEAVSFVNPARVPQMAEAEMVLDKITRRAHTHYAGLALNARGMERAQVATLDEVRFAIVASDSFSRRNQGLSTGEALATFGGAASDVKASGKRLTAVIAAAFGCPCEGEVDPGHVADLALAAAEAGANEIMLADTIGTGVPVQIRDLANRIAPHLGGRPLGLHLHNTRNTGYANALAGLEAGITVLDCAVGGVGGCPFAPKATGNIATEDLAWMLERSGIATGLDIDALLRLSQTIRDRVGASHSGALLDAGRFPETTRRDAA